MAAITLNQAQSLKERLLHTALPRTSAPDWAEELAAAERRRRVALQWVGQKIREADTLLRNMQEPGLLATPEGAALAEHIRFERNRLFASIQEHAPSEAYYWTPEWQAGEREVEAQIAAGDGVFYPNEAAFDAVLHAIKPIDADV